MYLTNFHEANLSRLPVLTFHHSSSAELLYQIKTVGNMRMGISWHPTTLPALGSSLTGAITQDGMTNIKMETSGVSFPLPLGTCRNGINCQPVAIFHTEDSVELGRVCASLHLHRATVLVFCCAILTATGLRQESSLCPGWNFVALVTNALISLGIFKLCWRYWHCRSGCLGSLRSLSNFPDKWVAWSKNELSAMGCIHNTVYYLRNYEMGKELNLEHGDQQSGMGGRDSVNKRAEIRGCR